MEHASFQLYTACHFARKHAKLIEIITRSHSN